MTETLAELTAALLDAAKSEGADAADVIAVSDNSVSISVRNGSLEEAERSEGIDIGLRVFVGQKQATVSASDTQSATLREMAERAVTMARLAPNDPYAGLADPGQLAHDTDCSSLDLIEDAPEPDPQALQDAAREAEDAALQIAGVTQIQAANASYGRRAVHLATSNGFSAGYGSTGHSVSCVAIAGEGTGMERDYDFDSRTHRSDLRSASEIGQKAGERAVERLGARKPATGTFPVVFDERIASSLIGHLLSAINGAAVARGSSWLLDAVGKQVLPDTLSLKELPHRPRIRGSRLFDAEGLPTAPRTVVDDGILTGWTLDLSTARKLGMDSTGNAARAVSSAPSPSVTHIQLTEGETDRDHMLRDMGTGLLVTSMIGSTINPNTGDYSRGASGFWIENGEIAYPINECTIAGNLRDMLLRIVPANDARTHLSHVVPSILIDGMTVAGA